MINFAYGNKIDWLKCIHGRELRYGRCPECEREKEKFKSLAFKQSMEVPKRIPIKRGCPSSGQGGCFCTGACQEIVGYREPLFPGEKP